MRSHRKSEINVNVTPLPPHLLHSETELEDCSKTQAMIKRTPAGQMLTHVSDRLVITSSVRGIVCSGCARADRTVADARLKSRAINLRVVLQAATTTKTSNSEKKKKWYQSFNLFQLCHAFTCFLPWCAVAVWKGESFHSLCAHLLRDMHTEKFLHSWAVFFFFKFS